MPVMVRPHNNSMKIAYKILGKPANLSHKRTEQERKIDRRLLFEETYRVR